MSGNVTRQGGDSPTLTLQFSTTAARQAFIDELLASLKTNVRTSPWRHVRLWGLGPVNYGRCSAVDIVADAMNAADDCRAEV